jgi:hypothetical protein
MKLISTLITAGLFAISMSAFAGGEMKEVCKDKMDKEGKVVMGKDGKAVQVCKTIKVHKKLEGNDIPPAPEKK